MTTLAAPQFAALAQLLRLRGGSAKEVARMALVGGATVPDAARAMGMRYHLAYKAVKRAKDGLALALIAVGEDAAVARPIGKNIISMCEIVESIGPCTAREVHNQAQQMLIVAVRKYLKRAAALDLLRIRRGDTMIFEVASGWRARIDAAPRKMTEPIPRASELLQAERITRRAIKVCPSSVFELHRHL